MAGPCQGKGMTGWKDSRDGPKWPAPAREGGVVKCGDKDGPKWPAPARVRVVWVVFLFLNQKIKIRWLMGKTIERGSRSSEGKKRPSWTPYRGPTWFFRLLTTLWCSTTGTLSRDSLSQMATDKIVIYPRLSPSS